VGVSWCASRDGGVATSVFPRQPALYFNRARLYQQRHPVLRDGLLVDARRVGVRLARGVTLDIPGASAHPYSQSPLAPAPVVDNYQVAASVSNGSPTQSSWVTVTAPLTNNGRGVAGATMQATWHYKATTPGYAGGTSGADGTMRCTRDISTASTGSTMIIDVVVSYQGRTDTTSTSFTPRYGRQPVRDRAMSEGSASPEAARYVVLARPRRPRVLAHVGRRLETPARIAGAPPHAR
jgi:hypothetical protein